MAILNPILNDRLQGDGAFAGIRASLNRLAMIVGNIRGGNGVNVWQRGNEIVIEADGSTLPSFTGTGWVNGLAVTGLNAYPTRLWLQIDMSTNPWTVTEIDGPPSSPWGDNVAYRYKPQVFGLLFFP